MLRPNGSLRLGRGEGYKAASGKNEADHQGLNKVFDAHIEAVLLPIAEKWVLTVFVSGSATALSTGQS
ncbi:hypothetical protein GCM10011499_28010 [Pelagibacterium lentulum]|uniref:Uncharacterized protein n=1 Tax=Pelagibacterium lentulum TaxID=2029865 RepID=A0A916W0E5_9HYPH|nr:hypothetical protein GCM10011499_28010 [Pelagibacterium lentulum]